MIAVELEPGRDAETFECALGLPAHPQLQPTPAVAYATGLNVYHIETAARSGLLWLQTTPTDILVAAVRDLLSAAVDASEAQ